MLVRPQIVPGSHRFPISPSGDLLSAEERELHAPLEKRLELELGRGEVSH